MQFRSLELGDYVVNERVVVERKSHADFAVSLVDGRLFRQAAALARSRRRSLVLLEGPRPAEMPKVHPHALEGAILAVAVTWRVPVISTGDAEESLRVLIMLSEQSLVPDEVALPRFGYQPRRLESRKLHVLQGLPGVVPKLARRLLAHFGSVEQALQADANMLSGINTIAFNHHQGRTFDFAYMGTLAYSREMFVNGFLKAGVSMAGGPGPGGQTYFEDPFVQLQYAPDQRHIWTWNIEGMLAERQGVGDHGVKRGVYSLLDYNFWLRWHAGFLLDIADRPDVPRGTETGISPILTYFVSDNTRLRLQYTHSTASGPERAANEVFLQATFSLGNLKPLD